MIGFLLIIYFIFGCAANYFYYKVENGEVIKDFIINFDNISTSIITLFKCSTTE